MSKYVDQMRAVLAELNTKALATGNAITEAHDQLSVANASEKDWELRETLRQAAAAAKDQIAAILGEAVAAANKWAELDGTKIDEADLALLRGDFDLSGDDIQRLVVKHQNNAVMLNAIARYTRKSGSPQWYVPTKEGKIQAYNTMAEGALKVIGSIVQSMGTDSETLAEWGKSGNVSQRIELVLYGIPVDDSGK